MRIKLLVCLVVGALLMTACSGGPRLARTGMGLTADYRLAGPDVKPKTGLLAEAETGRRLFASSTQTHINGGTNTFFAEALPQAVRVTWREDTEVGKYWTSGRIVGDHTIRVRDRVPAEVLQYANAARGRLVRLLFRIQDDGVLFAWDVEETVRHPSGGSGVVYSLHGGDIECPPTSRTAVQCTTGRLEDAPWYNKVWIRNK
jgi:hypothetical protein